MAEPIASAPTIERSEGYLRLLSFVIANARVGELMAIDNYCDMVRILPTVEEKIETVRQAMDEGKHVIVLEELAKSLNVLVDPELVEPQWGAVRLCFAGAAEKADLAGCLIIQDLMVESLAIALYRTFASVSNFDVVTRKVASKLLDDELDHLKMGVARIHCLMEKDASSVKDALLRAHHRVMPLLFEMVHDSCQFLCRRAQLDCNVVVKPNEIDLDMLKTAAVDHYLEMLASIGFDSSIIGSLFASMAFYEPSNRVTIDMRDVL